MRFGMQPHLLSFMLVSLGLLSNFFIRKLYFITHALWDAAAPPLLHARLTRSFVYFFIRKLFFITHALLDAAAPPLLHARLTNFIHVSIYFFTYFANYFLTVLYYQRYLYSLILDYLYSLILVLFVYY